MPKMTVTTEFNIALARRITGERIFQAMGVVGLDALAAMRAELSIPGTGNIYPRGKNKTHQASIPGAPPAPDMGDLKNSTGVEVFRIPGGAAVVVTVMKEYATPLHFGTEKDRPAARPFAQAPLRAKNLKRYVTILKRFT